MVIDSYQLSFKGMIFIKNLFFLASKFECYQIAESGRKKKGQNQQSIKRRKIMNRFLVSDKEQDENFSYTANLQAFLRFRANRLCIFQKL